MDSSIETLKSAQTSIDCACLIHGNFYSWIYVERLYNMLNRYLGADVRLHVYTEAERPVPAPMIKHALIPWGIAGPKLGWWYKMQLFDSKHHSGPLLYFDLDTVIVDNIDWIHDLSLKYFWAVRDFKYLWKNSHYSVNSSVMWWDTSTYDHVWTNFIQKNLKTTISQYRGDQDYINQAINSKDVRFLDSDRVKSWRWECLDGGYNFKQKKYQNLGNGTTIPENTDILVFHGNPKPHKITDSLVLEYWQ